MKSEGVLVGCHESRSLMRVATWNLDHARPGDWARTPRLQQAMRDVPPADVWVLTETHPEVAPAPGFTLTAVSNPAPDRPDDECWVAIWVRRRLAATPLPMHGDPERTAAVLIGEPGGRPVLVVGTVLPWRQDSRRHPRRGGDAFCDALVAQAADWHRLRSDHPIAELCVVGDFNIEVGHRLWAGTKAGRAAFAEVLAAHRLSCATGGADDLRARRGWGPSIDHVLVSPGLRVSPDTGVGIWPLEQLRPSSWTDHHGIWVDIEDARADDSGTARQAVFSPW